MNTLFLLKRFYDFLKLFASILIFYSMSTGCDSDKEKLKVTPTTLNFPYTGGESEFDITSNTKWTVDYTYKSYITLGIAHGEVLHGEGNGTVKVTAYQNNNYGHEQKDREAEITVRTTGEITLEKTVKVTIEKNPAWLRRKNGTPITFTPVGGQIDVPIETNMEWRVDARILPTYFAIHPMSGSNDVTLNIFAPRNVSNAQIERIFTIKGQLITGKDTIRREITFVVHQSK